MNSHEASEVIDRLGDAFGAADVERVVALFATEGDIIYAGSEPSEVAVGQSALRLLLNNLFSRTERYAWKCDAVHTVACAAGILVLADATLFVTEKTSDAVANDHRHQQQSAPYRVSGLLEKNTAGWRWRFCQGSEPA